MDFDRRMLTMPDQDQLILIRRQFGLSQEEMSRLLGVNAMSVSRWERGVNGCPSDTLVWYALFQRALAVWPPANKMPRPEHCSAWLDVEGKFGALYRIMSVIYS